MRVVQLRETFNVGSGTDPPRRERDRKWVTETEGERERERETLHRSRSNPRRCALSSGYGPPRILVKFECRVKCKASGVKWLSEEVSGGWNRLWCNDRL